ncbi:dipicolinate synthase subunit B [Acetivibrio mesophilus]|uniref:Dipicolinate synthase subunit B n=1 Tax=Acetivibrio mesophilus TaxID=2487273 RepID=A0A4Q0I7C2_9FIRM|nr:dipicolinate synthase subunit B [Acetivibrio mesophilus]ODM25720.1 dipicolinate synthase subunit B [Clostridium sp. Bc-iso-3]RXE60304.1 dipicolinate synthase subunit B [Acetivibrio mesophilus]HHV30429.1 dipicolinate synthase subunit B [Clostridium sp.]
MLLDGIKIGFGITGSFCTLDKVIPEVEKLVSNGAKVFPILSDSVSKFDTRFGRAEDFRLKLEGITGNKIINSIIEAEPIGPKSLLDIIVVAPCTGNTLAKIANGITDTTVTMACKAHLRNQKPLVIAISTNDGLGANAKNIGMLLNMKNIYLVPFGQDGPGTKPNSLVADTTKIMPTILEALNHKQIQPLLIKY